MIIKLATLIDPSKFGPSSLAKSVSGIWNKGVAKVGTGVANLASNVVAPTAAVKSFAPVAQTAVKSFIPALNAAKGSGQAGFIAAKRGLLG